MKVGVDWAGLAACLLAGSVNAAVFTVPPGDADALEEALIAASANGEADVIELAHRSAYVTGHRGRPGRCFGGELDGRIVINGNGAVLNGQDDPLRPLCVTEGGVISVNDLHVTRFWGARTGVIVNAGHLDINNSAISLATLGGKLFGISMGIIRNEGLLRLENVTMSGNASVAIVGGGQDVAVVWNAGEAEIRSSTIALNRGLAGLGTETEKPNTLRVANSIIALSGPETCVATDQAMESLGHNIDDDGSCGFDRPTDQPDASPRLGAFGHHGGLVPTIALQAGSSAISAANRDRCPVLDARGFVRADGPRWDCDIGAFERDGRASDIGEALTATWFSVREDGHFFTIQVIGDDREQVLVHWNTFDAEGRPLWLQGVGAIDGHRSDMVLYEYGGMRFPDFDTADRTITPWGTLSLAFASCWRAVAAYEALEPGLGSGHSRLIRLINTAGLSCGGG